MASILILLKLQGEILQTGCHRHLKWRFGTVTDLEKM